MRSRSFIRAAAGGALLVAMAALLAGCGGGAAPVPPRGAGGQGQAISLTGAGATFPYPLYSRWFDVYEKQSGVRINYQSIGSGGGIRQLLERTVDFGASDAPMTDEQLAAAAGKILHIPTVLGAVVVSYHLPGVEAGLRLRPGVLAGIFLGEITRWNDPRVAQDNPGLKLPDMAIAVVHRSDGSGTTAIFTDYLSAVSPAWRQRVGKGTSVNWPVGLGGKGNEGLTGQVKQTPGALGYMELAYAVQNRLPYAALLNRAGRFVEPTLESTTAAAASAAASLPDDLRVSIVDPPGEQSYPIAGFTYLLVYQEQADRAKGRALADFLWWALHEGQGYAKDLLYAPLPAEVVQKAEAKVRALTFQGSPLRQD